MCVRIRAFSPFPTMFLTLPKGNFTVTMYELQRIFCTRNSVLLNLAKSKILFSSKMVNCFYQLAFSVHLISFATHMHQSHADRSGLHTQLVKAEPHSSVGSVATWEQQVAGLIPGSANILSIQSINAACYTVCLTLSQRSPGFYVSAV